MTGHYNVRNYIRFGMMDRKLTTFAHLMKRGGYKTCIVGKWQLGQELDSPQHFGFNESCLFHDLVFIWKNYYNMNYRHMRFFLCGIS